MTDETDEPTTKNPFSKTERFLVPDESRNPDDAKSISPFKIINRGEDTLNADEQVVFADFSPRVVPSDTPDEIVEVGPKDVSAPGPAPSSESMQINEQPLSETIVPAPAEPGDGTLKPSEDSSQSSSTSPKSGPSEPTA